jgi:hypothetical protein
MNDKVSSINRFIVSGSIIFMAIYIGLSEISRGSTIKGTWENAVLWSLTSCGYCRNRRFGEHISSIIRIKGIRELGTMLAVANN